MKRLLLLFLCLYSVASVGQPGRGNPLQSIERASGPGQFGLTDVNGIQRYNDFTRINTTPLASDPPATGNTTNLSQYVTGPTGNVYYIDYLGNRLLIQSESVGDQQPTYDNRDTIRQVSHGFSLPINQRVRHLHQDAISGDFVYANTSASNLLPVTHLIEIINVDSFVVMAHGVLWNTPHTMTTRNFLYLQDDGSFAVVADGDDCAGGGQDYEVSSVYAPDVNTIWLFDPFAEEVCPGDGGGTSINARNGIGPTGEFVELGFPLIRNTTVDGASFNMLWQNNTIFEASAQNLDLFGSVDLDIGSPFVKLNQLPPSADNTDSLVMRNPENGQLRVMSQNRFRDIVGFTGAQNGVGMNGSLVELGFPLIRSTEINGGGFDFTMNNLENFRIVAGTQVSLQGLNNFEFIGGSSGTMAAPVLTVNGTANLNLGGPVVNLNDIPPVGDISTDSILLRNATTGRIRAVSADRLGGGGAQVQANQGLTVASPDTVQIGAATRGGVSITNDRFINVLNDVGLEMENTSTVPGGSQYLFRLRGNNTESSFVGMSWENVPGSVSAFAAVTSSTFGLGTTSANPVNFTYDSELYLGLRNGEVDVRKPLTMRRQDLTGYTVSSQSMSLAVSDGTIGRTGQSYWIDEDENVILGSEKIISQVVTTFNVPIAVGLTDWAWTTPPLFAGYQVVGYEVSFVSASNQSTTLSINFDGSENNQYRIILPAGDRQADRYPFATQTLAAGTVVRGEVVTDGGASSPAEGFTITLILAR